MLSHPGCPCYAGSPAVVSGELSSISPSLDGKQSPALSPLVCRSVAAQEPARGHRRMVKPILTPAIPGAEIMEAKVMFLERCWAGGTGGGEGQRGQPNSLKGGCESRPLKSDQTGPRHPVWSRTGVGTAPGGCDQNTGAVSWPGVPTAHKTCLSLAASN